MSKFQNLNEAFWYIRKNPLEYLPEKSLELFNAFWIGYELRYEVEFKEYKGFELLDGFHEYMCVKYKVPSNRNSYGIAEFYSKNQAEAFDLWFADLEEFLSKKDGTTDVEKYYAARRKEDIFTWRKEMNFFGLIKTLQKRIAMYVGSISFTLAVSLISGWLKATEDFEFEESEQEKIFKDFQKYIEDKPFGLRAIEYLDLPPMPAWNKIIWFRTARTQKEEGALELFAKYFDEFAIQGKGFVEDIEFSWKVHHETLEKYDRFTYGKFLIGKNKK